MKRISKGKRADRLSCYEKGEDGCKDYREVGNGNIHIEAKELVSLFDRNPLRKFERKRREDEKETNKVNVVKWHIEKDELKQINNFQ